MFRRQLLTIAAGSPLALAACGTTLNTTVLTTVSADVTAIAGGLLGVLPTIGGVTGLDASQVTDISTAITALQTLAQQVSTVTSVSAAQPIVQQVETEVNTVVSALAMVPILPPPVAVAVQAINILLPVIEAAVNLIVPAKLMARVGRSSLTPDQARQILRTLAPTYLGSQH